MLAQAVGADSSRPLIQAMLAQAIGAYRDSRSEDQLRPLKQAMLGDQAASGQR